MSNFSEKVISLLYKVGELLKKKFDARHFKNTILYKEHKFKEEKELLLEEDIISNELLISELKIIFPHYNIYSEEMCEIDKLIYDKQKKILIDPLDGTHNFFYGIPMWGITVTILDENSCPLAGYIYLPLSDFLVYNDTSGREKTIFIYKNEIIKKMQTSQCVYLSEAIITYDNQFYKLTNKAVSIYHKLIQSTFTTRITGSSAYDVVMIACGKFEARVWNNVLSHDIAAGFPIIRGAGGIISDFNGLEGISILEKTVFGCANKQLKIGLLHALNHL